MGTKAKPGKFDCLAKAADDEPVFVLLGRDPAAAMALETWINVRAEMLDHGHKPDSPAEREQLAEARACLDTMRAYHGQVREAREREAGAAAESGEGEASAT